MINIWCFPTSVILEIQSNEGGEAFYRFDDPSDLLDTGISLIKDSLLLAANQEEKDCTFEYMFNNKKAENVLDEFVEHIQSEITSDPTLYDDLEQRIDENNDTNNDSDNSDD